MSNMYVNPDGTFCPGGDECKGTCRMATPDIEALAWLRELLLVTDEEFLPSHPYHEVRENIKHFLLEREVTS